MNFQVITLQPEFFHAYLKDGVVGQAYKSQKIHVELIQPRDFADDFHKSVDDRPFGGGDGMVMMPEVLEKALLSRGQLGDRVLLMSAQGKKLDEKKVMELSQLNSMTLVCGRYAGVDQRFINQFVHDEISIGDFVLSGGEIAALAVIDAVSRKIPGVLGHATSAEHDSFANNSGLEGPLFTRPQVYSGVAVPSILLSGNHAQIRTWRLKVSQLVTLQKRPDLSSGFNLSDLKSFYKQMSPADRQACGLTGVKFE